MRILIPVILPALALFSVLPCLTCTATRELRHLNLFKIVLFHIQRNVDSVNSCDYLGNSRLGLC